jgi:GH15 family glucan-1,4-alpha-glucosidase
MITGASSRVMRATTGTTNDLGLFAEEYEPRGKRMGTFPQGFSHLSHIIAAEAVRPGAE